LTAGNSQLAVAQPRMEPTLQVFLHKSILRHALQSSQGKSRLQANMRIGMAQLLLDFSDEKHEPSPGPDYASDVRPGEYVFCDPNSVGDVSRIE